MLTKEDVAASPCCLHPAVRKGINLLAFLKQSGKDSAISKHKLKKREALLLNSYNLRNVVNNSLSLPDVLTFYFGSAVPPPDILALRQHQFAWAEGRYRRHAECSPSSASPKFHRETRI
ncbi:hypothetical protein [Rhizobium sp. ERR 1071]|uniref:hypothetical protein n=1 Tax=Rhizobium sp. ERR 1071 TaxID=2572677 RepID=UPI00119E44FF|nr:hypothetical protein [Rhizobium sp. ERR1071]